MVNRVGEGEKGRYMKFNVPAAFLSVHEIISAVEPLLSAQNEKYRRLNHFYRHFDRKYRRVDKSRQENNNSHLSKSIHSIT